MSKYWLGVITGFLLASLGAVLVLQYVFLPQTSRAIAGWAKCEENRAESSEKLGLFLDKLESLLEPVD